MNRTIPTTMICWAAGAAVAGLRADELRYREPVTQREVVAAGAVVGTANGRVLLLAPDGQMHVGPTAGLSAADAPEVWGKRELKAALAKEFPGYALLESGDYLIVHNCPVDAARSAARLLTKSRAQLVQFFEAKGLRPTKPKQPLVALVFATGDQYREYVRTRVGPDAVTTRGLYDLRSNRILLYDAFSPETRAQIAQAATVRPDVARDIAAWHAADNISVFVHESIHQSAFNVGIHRRNLADTPSWLVEGLATFFEVPDLDGTYGWKGGKTVNPERAPRLAKLLPGLEPARLDALVFEDNWSRDRETALDGYALSWGLTYYLLKSPQHQRGYVDYLRRVNELEPLSKYPAERRLADFRASFGKSPGELAGDLRKHLAKALATAR